MGLRPGAADAAPVALPEGLGLIAADTPRSDDQEEACLHVEDESMKHPEESVDEHGDRQLNVEHLSPVQTGSYFGMLHERGSDATPSKGLVGDALSVARAGTPEAARVHIIEYGGDSPSIDSGESPDMLSAGDSSEEDDGIGRFPLPRTRATPRHLLVIGDEMSTDCPSSDGRSADGKIGEGHEPMCRPAGPPGKAVSEGELARALREEEVWFARKELTGAVARMVNYAPGERPSDDILALQRTPHGHVMVASLMPDGPASMAGITRGDKLVSINGRKSFVHVREDLILTSLRGPVTLVFLGFVGKVQAEVQVAQPDAPSCGLPETIDVAGVMPLAPAASIHQHDTVVFRQPDDALILEKISQLGGGGGGVGGVGGVIGGGGGASVSETLQSRLGNAHLMYELQRQDAQTLLRQALRPGKGVEGASPRRDISPPTPSDENTGSEDVRIRDLSPSREPAAVYKADNPNQLDRPSTFGLSFTDVGLDLPPTVPNKSAETDTSARPKTPVFFI